MPHAQKAFQKKKIKKRCIPNEGMPHAARHVKRKKMKDTPHLRKIKKRDGSSKGVHPPSVQKKIHTLAHLDQIV